MSGVLIIIKKKKKREHVRVCSVVYRFRKVTLCSLQHQDREGEKGARPAARDDPDGDQRGRDSRGDGEGETLLSASDVRGQ